MPIFCASFAETGSPVNIKDAALCIPINLGSIKVAPLSGISPILPNAWIKLAFSLAIIISQAIAKLAPAPAATPLTAATTGFSILLIILIQDLEKLSL